MSINKMEYSHNHGLFLHNLNQRDQAQTTSEVQVDFQQRAVYFLIDSVLNSLNDGQIVKLLWKMGLVQDWVSF